MLDKSSLDKAAQTAGGSAIPPPPRSSSAKQPPLPVSTATTSSSAPATRTQAQNKKDGRIASQRETWSNERQSRDFLFSWAAFKEWYRHASLFHRCSSGVVLVGMWVNRLAGDDSELTVHPFAVHEKDTLLLAVLLILFVGALVVGIGGLSAAGAWEMTWTFFDGVAWLCTRASVAIIRAILAAVGLSFGAVAVAIAASCLWIPLCPVVMVVICGVSKVTCGVSKLKATLPPSLFRSISGTLFIHLIHLLGRHFFTSFTSSLSRTTLTSIYFVPSLLVVGDLWLEGLLKRVAVAASSAVEGEAKEQKKKAFAEGENEKDIVMERLRLRVEELEKAERERASLMKVKQV